ncbi:MAG: sarcosine oxidase, partial [Alphaproteobacteria bacterium]
MNASVDPASLRVRGFLYRELAALGARFAPVNGSAAALELQTGEAAERAAARAMGLADVSALRRGGYKGWAALDWLGGQGVAMGANNTTVGQPDGSRVARLADSEALILGDLDGRSVLLDRVEAAWSIDTAVGAYPVPRPDTNAWFALTGAHAWAMMAKLCGVDLRPKAFADGAVAQTSVARMSAIVIRHDLGRTLGYDLILDSASAAYLWG